MIINNDRYEMKQLLEGWKRQGLIRRYYQCGSGSGRYDRFGIMYASKSVLEWYDDVDGKWRRGTLISFYWLHVDPRDYRKFLNSGHLYALKIKRLKAQIDMAPLGKVIEQIVDLSVIDRVGSLK